MRKQLIRNVGLALLAAASVYAQGSQRMTVQVPFGFHAGTSMLPSGEYTVDTDAAPGIVRLRSADSKSSAMILTHNVQTLATPGQGKLVFHRYGDDYFLSQIWKAGQNTGNELRPPRREIEVAARANRGSESIMASK